MPKREARGKKARGAASGAVPTDALAEAETLIARAARQRFLLTVDVEGGSKMTTSKVSPRFARRLSQSKQSP